MRNPAAALLSGAILALTGCGGSSGLMSSETDPTAVKLAEFPDRPYWGDLHLHTANSIDAFGVGARLMPEDALRFASGEKVTSSTGLAAQLDRPLDWLAVTDHAEGLGSTRSLAEAPTNSIRDPKMKRWHDLLNAGPVERLQGTFEILDGLNRNSLPAEFINDKVAAERTSRIWDAYLDTMERYNRPGKFTTLLGFEYTLMDGTRNLHRNVIFRDGKDKVSQVQPLSSVGQAIPDGVWDYMDAYEQTTGGKVLAIPHNSNLSNGLMFELTQPGGGPMSAAYARRRIAHEPLVEITQVKGDSEAHPYLSPNDEFAGYGVAGWELGDLVMTELKKPSHFEGEYVREALKRGLAIQARTGINPYKFGVVGSTDSHTGLSTADENNFFGKFGDTEPSAKRMLTPYPGTHTGRLSWQLLASGRAAVWARANTREEIFDAMMRKEVYGTTGPRMTVRVFGGWDFAPHDLKGDWVRAGYGRGVPMGGTLQPAPVGKRPSFMISALKDPLGANLDRVQVVKGWVDKAGVTHEKVFDVAWSDKAKRRPINDKVPAVGDTVDIAKASYTNSIGAPELTAVWSDPEFDSQTRAFYYVRVLEIPTPNWVAFDAMRFNLKLPPDIIAKGQERAYTSAIWYDPSV